MNVQTGSKVAVALVETLGRAKGLSVSTSPFAVQNIRTDTLS